MIEEPLQHDPRIKQQIKDMLYNTLYAPVQEQFRKRLEALIYRNTVLMGASHKSFVYKGVTYSCDSTPPPRRKTRLHPQLKDEIEEYDRDVKHLNDTELPYVLGFINQVLNSSNDLCDYLRILPESLHDSIRKLIATYPCRAQKLTEDTVHSLQERNEEVIRLIKERMVLNLLL